MKRNTPFFFFISQGEQIYNSMKDQRSSGLQVDMKEPEHYNSLLISDEMTGKEERLNA